MERKFSIDELRRRLELALRPAEPPTVEEVLEHVSNHGVLRGPVDWAFPAWITYVEYATQRVAETFPLSEEERRAFLNFRETLTRLLWETWMQTKEKLKAVYKAIKNGTCRIEGKKLYAPDGTWMYVGRTVMHIPIHGISAETYFPDVLKLPREKLELLQLGWRASDEGNEKGRPFMGTTQPWQVFAWIAARYGALRIHITSANLTREGVSVAVHLSANSWRQRWSKDEAVDLVASYLRRGEWTPLLTMWLGDGKAERKKVLRGKYKLVVAAKEPWRLGNSINAKEALVARGREAFMRLRESAGVYGELLNLLKAHKWIDVKLATDNDFRAAYKLKARKRSIDVLREAYGQNDDKISTEFSHMERPRRGAVAVTGVVMSLYLVSGQGVSLLAGRYVRDAGKALAIAGRLEAAELRPNVARVGSYYMVYIATTDLLRLAERDEAVRRAIALYLTEKAENGTPRQREIARKLLQKHPLFLSSQSPRRLLEAGIAMR